LSPISLATPIDEGEGLRRGEEAGEGGGLEELEWFSSGVEGRPPGLTGLGA